ncbi:MAG: TerC family protein [Chlorobiales bacterium]|jgi:tellurite resistance protein TerC|nr:TerC family protein [Chlorobiales bacterium]
MSSELIAWMGFLVFVFAMLVLDLGFFQRKTHAVSIKESLVWSAVWITLALIFNGIIYLWHGPQSAMAFLAGYLIEKSLSVDNLFVFLLIFSYFRVPQEYQHKILFWGILGALLMRAVFIGAGVALLQQFHWIIYVFGAFLIYTGFKVATEQDKELHPERNPVLKLFKKIMPVTHEFHDGKFFVRSGSRTFATPLFVVLLIVETTDVVFAVDSIPAILSITSDPFIVYTSNVFAILGLRSLYFALAGIMQLFHYLNYGLATILVFVGVKMLISDFYKIPTDVALGAVAGILAVSIAASLLLRPATEEKSPGADTNSTTDV